ncbi:MAG: glycosyltransferase [Chloroflexota bacterium]|nr:glycosyltransferase [Chloroflexota bacterium]
MIRTDPPAWWTEVSTESEDYLIASGMLDQVGYRFRAGLPEGVDAAAHYLHVGWRIGLEPNAQFDGTFLRPFYEAAGHRGPPALTWLDLSALGIRVPRTRAEAEHIAARVRASDVFDAAAYSRLLPAGMDPALHYTVIGEGLGWPPSEHFDPGFYRARYEDIAVSGESPLWHYTQSGKHEGRRPIPAVARLAFPPLPNRERPVVLLICHEASRTGAPVLGWNLARRLAERYVVVTLLMRGGVLEPDFAAASAAVVGPMTWEEWHPAEASLMAERLAATYAPVFAISNSVETGLMVPALAARGVPSVALVHEFAAYTRPLSKMRDAFDWATHVIFPAQFVAESCFEAFAGLACRRGMHVLPQGRPELPSRVESSPDLVADDLFRTVMAPGHEDAFVVLSAGSVHLRKGVDLFLSTAAAAHRLAPHVRFRFVWIGDGYDPERDIEYSAYLREQIARSGLKDSIFIFDSIVDLEPAFASTDVFFMCSRLDPQPNVGIDAVSLGIPTVCFESASGTAEALAADPETRSLVVPHLDTHAAAMQICRLAEDESFMAKMREAVARVGRTAYDMQTYVENVDRFGRAARAAVRAEDLRTLVESGAADFELALPPSAIAPGVHGAEQHILAQWSIVGTSAGQLSNPHFRRPCAGFHPQAYALAHPIECGEAGQNPTAHWVRAGRPRGPWSHQVFSPLEPPAPPKVTPRVALHAHFYYPELAPGLATRLADNRLACDLFVSTDTSPKAEYLQEAFAHHNGLVDVRVMPNRGRDLGPLLTGLAHEVADGGYDVFGHVHGKRSVSVDATMGDLWREFLWDNLIGGEFPVLDLAASAFASDPTLGLLMADEPHLAGWDGNRKTAECLASRMGIVGRLPEFFDFPLGTMFWARPSALGRLLDLGLAWTDFPDEPLAYDGTLLHAIERLLPFVVNAEGFAVASIRVPGTTW